MKASYRLWAPGEMWKRRTAQVIAVVLLVWGFPALLQAGDRPDIHSFSSTDRADLYSEMLMYITSPIVMEHMLAPCDKHGFARFLVWHRNYIKNMEDFLISRGKPQFVPLPKWDANTCIPAEFFTPSGGVDPDCPAIAVSPCTGLLSHTCNALVNQCPNQVQPASLKLPALCSQTSFPGFRFALEANYHNPVHGLVGGAMGAFKSPAAPIFWLWHAFIDDIWFEWQCDCGLDESGAFSSYTAAEQNVDLEANRADLWIQDSDADIANEPNNETGSVLWASKDIWVRNQRATHLGGTLYDRYSHEHQHENPEYASAPADKPYIYVKVRNRGCDAISGQVRVYWANASTGLIWDTSFTEVPTSPVIMNNIDGGRDEVAEFHWSDIPAPTPTTGDHFCLVARFEAIPTSADPITGEQSGVSVWENVKNSNQIAWKNVTIVDNVANKVGVLVSGPIAAGAPVSLRFDVPLDQKSESFFEFGTLSVDLRDLFPIWLAGGAAGKGIKVVEEDQILVFGPGASIENLFIDPGDQYLIDLTFDQVIEACENSRTTFEVIVEEHVESLEPLAGQDTVFGGNTYLVVMDTRESPPVVATPVDPLVNCTTGTVALTSSATPPPGHTIAARQWLLGDNPIPGADQADYTAGETGEYSLLVTYSNGCESLSLPLPVQINDTPVNDDVCNATPLILDAAHEYNNFCAGVQPGEVSPPPGSDGDDGCHSHDGWCAFDTDVQNSLWFTFVAPTSGVVSIRIGEHDHANLQVALWDVLACSDFTSFALIAANDDSGDHGVWGTDPELHELSGLTPGNTYHIQLDGFDGWLATGTIIVSEEQPHCPADLNGDGVVAFADLLTLLSSWGPCTGCPADLNGDGTVSFADLLHLLSSWGPC